jgi:hypothetical protein
LCARRCRVHPSQLQGIVSEAEFPKFIEALQQPLPVSLRISALDPSAPMYGRCHESQCLT